MTAARSTGGPPRPGAEAASPLLDVDGLRIVFPDPRRGPPDGPDGERAGKRNAELAAVDGIAFTVGRGETLGIVGESGSGKSLTALAIMGLVPVPGRVTARVLAIDGDDVRTLSDRAWRKVRGRRVAMIFQEPMTALNPVERIGDQIAEVLRIHDLCPPREAMERAVALLDQVKIPEPQRRARSFPHQLSGGQRQRAMIAMALAGEPDLLIADEPTTALDVTVQAEVMDLLAEIKRARDMGMIFISHNLGLVGSIADRIAVMYAGRICEIGPARRVLATPRHPYTAALIATVPRLRRDRGDGDKRRLPTIEGVVPGLAARPSGCRFQPRCARATERCARDEPDLTSFSAANRDSGPNLEVACWHPLGRTV